MGATGKAGRTSHSTATVSVAAPARIVIFPAYLPGLRIAPRQSTMPTVTRAGVTPETARRSSHASSADSVEAEAVQGCGGSPSVLMVSEADASGPPSVCTSLRVLGAIASPCACSAAAMNESAAKALGPRGKYAILSHLTRPSLYFFSGPIMVANEQGRVTVRADGRTSGGAGRDARDRGPREGSRPGKPDLGGRGRPGLWLLGRSASGRRRPLHGLDRTAAHRDRRGLYLRQHGGSSRRSLHCERSRRDARV